MIGLIIKDIISLKKNLRILFIIFVLYGFMSIVSKDMSFFTGIFTILFGFLTLNLYSYDEHAKWDTYALTLPIQRKDLAKVKYVMMILLNLTGLLISLLFNIIYKYTVDETVAILDNTKNNSIIIATIIILYSILLPVITKIGVDKARIIMIGIYAVPFLGVYLVEQAMEKGTKDIIELVDRMSIFVNRYGLISIPLIALVAVLISYYISKKINENKEF